MNENEGTQIIIKYTCNRMKKYESTSRKISLCELNNALLEKNNVGKY